MTLLVCITSVAYIARMLSYIAFTGDNTYIAELFNPVSMLELPTLPTLHYQILY